MHSVTTIKPTFGQEKAFKINEKNKCLEAYFCTDALMDSNTCCAHDECTGRAQLHFLPIKELVCYALFYRFQTSAGLP